MGPSRRIILLVIFITSITASCYSGKEPVPDCDIQSGPCVKRLANAKVTFDLSPKPVQPMKELQFTVNAENLSSYPERVMVNLSMPGMEMGLNQIVLKRAGDGTYPGKGLIVKCPKGGRLWKAVVWIPEFGEIEYLFRVE